MFNLDFFSFVTETGYTVAWATDTHLDFVDEKQYQEFLLHIKSLKPDVFLICGDIATANRLEKTLRGFEKLACPVYFILGNHDYYGSSIHRIRTGMRELTEGSSKLHYLTQMKLVELTPKTVLIGHDSWADGRAGNFIKSNVMLNDYLYIEELAGISKEERWEELKRLSEEGIDHVKHLLPTALERYEQVIFITHPPPFLEVCLAPDRKLSDDNWAPHFVAKQLGDVLIQIMQKYPKKQLIVLAGHSHTCTEKKMLPNLHAVVGGAVYFKPKVQGIFSIT